MRYHCVQCDLEFETEAGDDKPRCPKCLRQYGLRPIESKAPAAAKNNRGVAIAVAALVVVAAGGGALYWKTSSASRSTAAYDESDLREAARKLTGLDIGDAADLFKSNAAIEAFAKQATSGKSSADDKAKAIVTAIRARGQKQAFVPWPLLEPRETLAQPAAEAFEALSKDGGRAELYPLEVAAVGVVALRSQDVPAQLVEVTGTAGDRTPLDPSGRFGYFAVGVPGSGAGAQIHAFDVYGGRTEPLPPQDVTALSDLQAAGGMLALRAMQRLVHAGELGGALQYADAAVKLSPSSSAARGVRAAVLLATGGKEEGARELEAATQLKPGPAQQNNLAMYALATGDTDRAAKLIAQALAAAPDYASGHLTLASVHLARLERDQATAELTQAERLDPKLPALSMAWAEMYAANGDMLQAQARAEEAVRARPKSPESHLLLARIHRQASHYDAMRAEARKVLELTPVAQKEQISQVLKAVLGPTALDADPSAEPEPGDVAAKRDGDGTELRPPGDPGSLQLGAREPKLNLGGGSKLKLDLSH